MAPWGILLHLQKEIKMAETPLVPRPLSIARCEG